MRTKFNRFAIFPVMCSNCHSFLFLEKYRRASVWHPIAMRHWDENICRSCIGKYHVSKSEVKSFEQMRK